MSDKIIYDVELACRKSDGMTDWYVIERKHHDGREWFERTGSNSFSLRTSARIGNADIEGSGAEMKAIARAIKDRREARFRRCAVRVRDDGNVEMSSPRNSHGPSLVPYARATVLADEILALETP
jgi:hypothetical protein